MTTTLSTDSRPTYTGPRTKWTKADGEYLVQICVPTAGRTFLMDESEDGPAAEFTRNTGLPASGGVGSMNGESAFLFNADFHADTDAEAVWMAQEWREAYGRTLSVRVLYWQPNETGASSVLVADLADL
jgi:hypothetical protein